MLLSTIIEITRGIGLMIVLAISMAIVPASGTLREAISSPQAVGGPLSRDQTPYFKAVLIVDSQGTCLALSEGSPVLLFTPVLNGQLTSSAAKGGKALKPPCRLNDVAQFLVFEDNQHSSFPPNPIDRAFAWLLKGQQNASLALRSPAEGPRRALIG
jgi:hypothetical protein